MNTLPTDLLTLVFNACTDNKLVDSFSLLYGRDFLRIKYQQVCQYIDTELGKLFGEQRYELFKEDSVLTGSLLLKLILQDDWEFNDVDIATTNPKFNISDVLKLKPKKDFISADQSWGFDDPIIRENIRTLLNIKSLDAVRFRSPSRAGIDIALIDSDQITIKDHIEHTDYEFTMNYAYYKDKKLRLFVANYLSVFNKESDFKISTIIWKSTDRYRRYRFRGFNIRWDHTRLKYEIDQYIKHVRSILTTQASCFIVSSAGDKYVPIMDKLKNTVDDDTMTTYIKMFILTELMREMARIDDTVLKYKSVIPDQDDWL